MFPKAEDGVLNATGSAFLKITVSIFNNYSFLLTFSIDEIYC
jgi:hypothetical protein